MLFQGSTEYDKGMGTGKSSGACRSNTGPHLEEDQVAPRAAGPTPPWQVLAWGMGENQVVATGQRVELGY